MNERPDEPYTSAHRRGYEQLLRKLLRLPGPPAVVLVRRALWLAWAAWRMCMHAHACVHTALTPMRACVRACPKELTRA